MSLLRLMKSFPLLLLVAAIAASCSHALSPATVAPTAKPTPAATASTVPLDTINVPAAKQLLTRPGTLVLDVRTPAEYLTGHLLQARNLDVTATDFAQQIAQLDPSKTYVVYCRSGKRSSKAIQVMRQQGFQRVVNGGSYDGLK